MKSWRARQCCGTNFASPFVVTISSFVITHNDAFPDGTYAEVTFDRFPVAPPIGASIGADCSADTSGGPEGLNLGTMGYVRNDGPAAVFNCTTIDQVDTFTDGGNATFLSFTGLVLPPGGVLIVPATVLITSSI